MPKFVPKADNENKEAKEEAEPKVEKVEKGKGKGKGEGKKGGEKRNSGVLSKTKALAQIVSLDEQDDEREATSKKISWILRKGYGRIGITDVDGGWIKVSDLLSAEILDDIDKSEEKLMSVIEESNKQKLRYQLKDGADGGKLIRALKKEERKSKSGAEPGVKAGEVTAAKEPTLAVEGHNKLRGDAPSFVPAAQAAQAASTLAGFTNPAMSYPGFWNPYGAMAMGYPGYGYPGYGYPGAAAAATHDKQGNRRFQGRIKSFNAEKGYGFIESPEAYQIHGRDVFLHKAHIGSFSVGTFISFVVETNKEGMPQARDISAGDGSGQAQDKGKGKGKGKKDGKGKKGEGKGKKEKKAKDESDDKDKGDDKGDDKGEAPASAETEGGKPAEAPASAADADKS